MEKRLNKIYSVAQKDMEKKVDSYFKRFEAKDEMKRKLVEVGELTEAKYKEWRKNQLLTGKHWKQMQKQISEQMLAADKTAIAYINSQLPAVYAMNYNSLAEQINRIKGYSFELADAHTVKNLATTNKTLLPYKYVDEKKVIRWNTKRVNAQVMQGIIQGESIPKIAKRLSENVPGMEKESAIRNARTTVTSAENKGRMDSYHEAEEMGIVVKKVWVASIDNRTRDAHRELNGQEEDVDTPFITTLALSKTNIIRDKIMYPGDPNANAANVYNCRCCLKSKIVSIKKR